MSTVTPVLNLVKPTTLEQYSLSVMNNNMDLIDAAAMRVDEANSTISGSQWSFLGCRFTRVRTGLKGIVIAEMVVTFIAALAIPSNTAATSNVANVIPAGYRPQGKTSIPVESALTSNAGVGQHVGIALESDGNFGIRSAGAAFTSTTNSQFYFSTAYRWDGVL